MKWKAKEGAAEKGILLRTIQSYKLSTEKAEKDIENIRKDVIDQTRNATDKKAKYTEKIV